ncbi:MAG: chitobiase/beta-hexosaminidase C-terminal domain-containing protein [Lachnospiraceae bacterium]|nr:chitobiase/beta-hexosaminidase C-terminal domain-containing protein [Lachnospiraceae bacterium]
MQCPECGREVPEGHVYCSGCGWEFHMVPAFEPEIENQIDKTLSRLAGKIDTDTQGAKRAPKNAPDKKSGRSGAGKGGRTKAQPKPVHMRVIPVALAVAASILLLVVAAKAHKTPEDYIRYAEKEYAAGNTEEAIAYLKQATEKAGMIPDMVFLLAEYQRESGDARGAIETLSAVFHSDAYSGEEKERLYYECARAYLELRDGAGLETLLESCPYEDVRKTFASYKPAAPGVSPEGGSFEEQVRVTLSAPEGCAVYYTIDGQEPSDSNARYEQEITLSEPGTYLLQAVAYSAEGMRSETVSASITVTEKRVPPPEVFEDSGTYREATSIVVHGRDNVTIYYTVDEEGDPDETDERYEKPIPMPDGRSSFKFIAVDENGRKSEVVEREYDLVIDRLVSEEQAVIHVKEELIRAGYMKDLNGSVSGQDGILAYTVENTVTIGNDGEYWFIREHHLHGDGRSEATGRLYAVNTRTGKAMRLGYDSVGQLVLVQIAR